jgi:2-polyprenyl-3-methyl-5-hydroxy-6-metoxy-1,4-benzoquinol methylase
MSSQKDQTNKETYDRIAEIYYTKHFNSETLRSQMDDFIERLKPGSRILDLGCGPGQCSKYFAERGFDVTGIDFSEKFLEIARENVPDVEFIQADILEHPFEQERYDAVWANAVLLHFTTEEVTELLSRIQEALSSKGVFYASFMEGSGERLFERVDKGVEDRRYFYDRNLDEIKSLVQDAGFEILSTDRLEAGPVVFIHFFARKR